MGEKIGAKPARHPMGERCAAKPPRHPMGEKCAAKPARYPVGEKCAAKAFHGRADADGRVGGGTVQNLTRLRWE